MELPIQSMTLKMEGVGPLNSIQWTKDVLDLIHSLVVDQKLRVRLTKGSTCLPLFAWIDMGDVNIQKFLVDNEFAKWI